MKIKSLVVINLIIIFKMAILFANDYYEVDKIYKNNDIKCKKLYQEILKKIDNEITKKEFVKSFELWKKYRESYSSFLAGMTSEGGSAYTLDYLENLNKITNIKINELNYVKKFLNNEKINE